MMILTDMTIEREAMMRAEELSSYSDMLTRFFADRDNFMRMLDLIKSQLLELKDCKIENQKDHEAALRQFHNIKSAASSLCAVELQKAAHDTESALILEWSRSLGHKDFEPMVHMAAQMMLEHYNTFLKEHHAIFGFYNNTPQNGRLVSFEALNSFYRKLSGLDPALKQEYVSEILMSPITQPLLDLKSHGQAMAKSLDKIVTIHVEANPTDKIYAYPYRRLFDSLSHLINNCIDHGFEIGKPGNLMIGASVTAQWLKIFVADDGCGIDPEQIRQKLYQMKTNCSRETDAQVIYHIFDPGFTTKPVASAISGRGIGMDSVHHEVKDLGGKIILHSDKGAGTRFDISVPFLTPDLQQKASAPIRSRSKTGS
jgi:chemotaxis protein histidine kinase CheA